LQAALSELFGDVRRLCDDERSYAVRQLLRADDARAFQSVHDVHGSVHEDARYLLRTPVTRFVLQQIQRLATVARNTNFITKFAKEHDLDDKRNRTKKIKRPPAKNTIEPIASRAHIMSAANLFVLM
jgi:hypothetical protein